MSKNLWNLILCYKNGKDARGRETAIKNISVELNLNLSLPCQAFSEDNRVVAELINPRVIIMGACGVRIDGFEFDHIDKHQSPVYRYQQWHLNYTE